MIFIAGSLGFHGGSTFLLRMAKQYYMEGKKCLIIGIAEEDKDLAILKELRKYSDIMFLRSLSVFPFIGGRFSLVVPFSKKKLTNITKEYGYHFHVMGVFGLIAANKISYLLSGQKISISIGIYHQNEFMYIDRSHFSQRILALFRRVNPSDVVFFNDKNLKDYASFYGVDYSEAQVAPIGIETLGYNSVRSFEKGLIVSVGNLVNFKTYNMHVIKTIKDLISNYSSLRYEIYGNGPEKDKLKKLVKNLELEDVVFFKGSVNYEDFANVCSRAMMFVGSGTALLEAANLSIPAVIGIESISTPHTYGFLGDVKTMSYHESDCEKGLLSYDEVISKLMECSVEEYRELASRDHRKSKNYGIGTTYEAFVKLERYASAYVPVKLDLKFWISLFWSFIGYKILGKKNFSERRNQSNVTEL